MKILILGWYNRKNLGDDCFAYIFRNLLVDFRREKYIDYELDIKNPKDITEIAPDTDVIICGGGALVNKYFMDKIIKLKEKVKKVFTIAVSIDIPYPQLVEEKYLDIFDQVFLRSTEDANLVRERLGSKVTFVFPDLATLLPNYGVCNFSNLIDYHKRFDGRKNLGVFIAYQYFCYHKPEKYQKILTEFCKALETISRTERYEIFLFSFDTKKEGRNDLQINEDIRKKLIARRDIHCIRRSLPIKEIYYIFSRLDLNICMRYHSHIFSLSQKVPFISIYGARKVRNFLKEYRLQEYSYPLELDPENDEPIEFDRHRLIRLFIHLNEDKNYQEMRDKLIVLRHQIRILNREFKKEFFSSLQSLSRRGTPPRFVYEDEIQEKKAEISHLVAKILADESQISKKHLRKVDSYIFRMEKGKQSIRSTYNRISDRGKEPNKKQTAKRLSRAICTALTGQINSEYQWGLEQQILKRNYKLEDSIRWILQDLSEKRGNEVDVKSKYPLSRRKFNINSLYQDDLRGYHRSGWQYVVDNLRELHNPDGILFDMYLDRTFHWARQIYTDLNIIPYRQPWVGVIHHTFNEDFGEYNCTKLFQTPEFLNSLDVCCGIYVLSNYLKEKVERALLNLGKTHIKVEALFHPTEIHVSQFKTRKFFYNDERKIVQIGAWLRDTYAIYRLPLFNHNNLMLQKAALRGKDMDNYFRPDWFYIANQSSSYQPVVCRDNTSGNKYVEGVLKLIDDHDKSVEIIPYQSDEDYDDLLTKNIVFLNLIDASAVNTLLECVVRSTPVLVNRLPAVEEILGEDYPLYYDDLNHAVKLVSKLGKIRKAHKYLKNLDKKKFTISSFIENLMGSDIYYQC